MSDEREWGPWIEWGQKLDVPSGVHVGDWYQGVSPIYGLVEKRVENHTAQSWANIIRSRIRKPRGLTILESLLGNLPEEVGA